uniref:Uncharacterized protein LOC113794119 n=1 Tax=Dermatophagoides pteronyssinus TaxID=6956 RepID=A0A6P6Y3E3_DERPT|nr:uncharacterized protein LOC113794119 [Dermatophagoides pteronyssinus]
MSLINSIATKISIWLTILAIILLAILHLANGAPRTIRDDGAGGGAFGFVTLDTGGSGFVGNDDSSHSFRNIIQTIIDMVKRMFGWDDRTAIVREDGTVEYIENGGNGSFLSRIGRRIMSFINMLLNMFMGDNSIPAFDLNTARSTIINELDKEGIHLNNG